MAPRRDDNLTRADIEELVATLKESAKAYQEDRKAMAVKIDAIPDALDKIRREQTDQLRALRQDFERLFVPFTKYDPEYRFLMDKVREYDGIIKDSHTQMEEYYNLKNTVKQQGLDHQELSLAFDKYKEHQSGLFSRVSPWILTAIAIISLVISVFQHVQFH